LKRRIVYRFIRHKQTIAARALQVKLENGCRSWIYHAKLGLYNGVFVKD